MPFFDFGLSGSRSPRSGYYGEGTGYAGSGYGGSTYGGNYNYGGRSSSRYETQEVRPSSSRRYEDAGSRYESLSGWQGAGLSRSRSGYPDSSARDRAAARSREVFLTGPGISRYETESRRPDEGARFRAASRYHDDNINIGGSRSYRESPSHGYASADYFNSSGSRSREQRSYARTGDGGYMDPFQASLNAERARGFGYGAEYGRSDSGRDRLARDVHLRNHNLGDRFDNYQRHGGGAYGRFR